MSRRSVLVLVAALMVLGVLFALGQRDRAPTASDGAAIMPGLEAALNDIERVALTRAGGEPVATLERRDGTWVVAEKGGYAADFGKLRESLRGLAQARVLETKTANPAFYDRLGVEDVSTAEAAGIEVSLTAAGADLPALILGNSEGSRYRYARRAGDAQSFLIDRNPDFPRAASQWVDARIIDVRSERIRQITITHPDGEVVTISKTDAGATNYDVAPIPAGRELLYPGVANVVGNALRELNLEDVEMAGTSAAGAEQQTVVEFRTFDGLVVRVIGTESENQAWVSFEASVDAEQAARSAAPAPETAAAEPAATPAAPPAGADDVADEAERINGRVRGWRYRIAGFQYDQMTRRMTDLLKPPPAA